MADSVYRERAHLTAYLAAQHPSWLVLDGDPEEPGWYVLYVLAPTGQMSWHVSPEDVDLFDHVRRITPEGFQEAHGGWDGHTTADKYERLRRLIPEPT